MTDHPVTELRRLYKQFQGTMCQRYANKFVNAFDDYARTFLGVRTRLDIVTAHSITSSGEILDNVTLDILGIPYSQVQKIKYWYS